MQLDEKQGRHLRNVLRMEAGEEVELFDAEGRRARGKIICTVGEEGVSVEVEKVEEGTTRMVHLTIAAAPPKGTRAEWMVEKLADLGVGC